MIDLSVTPSTVQSASLVGAVLVEALVLYAGYGAFERVAAKPIVDRIENG